FFLLERYIAIEPTVEDDKPNVPVATMTAHASLDSMIDAAPLATRDPTVLRPIEDDRDTIQPRARVLLLMDVDRPFARIMPSLAHENGYKAVVSTRKDSKLALANQLKPDAISLDLQLPVLDGWRVLDRLKRNANTRHIPVHVTSIGEL